MSGRNNIVLTAYGHGRTVDRISVCSFDEPDDGKERPYCLASSRAGAYCEGIQSLALEGDSWVTARIVSEFSQYAPQDLVPLDFDILLLLDDRSIQKVMREVDSQELAKALKGSGQEIQDKIFRNMSKRAAGMLKEDMEYMGPVWIGHVEEMRKKIVDIIRRLEREGDIVIAGSGEYIVV